VRTTLPSLVFLTLVALAAPPSDATSTKPADPADRLFTTSRIWLLRIKISPEQFRAMQPPARPPGPRPPAARTEEFPYVRADLEFEGRTFANVGLRYKGNSSFRAPGAGPKRPFHVDVNRFEKGLSFLGLAAFNLNNNAMDPSQMRESLAYALFRDAGVPAPRTAYVVVYLHVPGVFDNQYLGLYTMVELVDKTFLRGRFDTDGGLLLKPEGARDLPYLGNRWADYKTRYVAKTGGDTQTRQRLIDFVRLIRDADDPSFERQLESLLDVDEFLRFLAVNTVLSNLDSFFGTGHNFYLYVHPQTLKVIWIPWDLNEAFAGFIPAGPPEVQMDLSIWRPYMGENRLVQRVLAIPRHRQAYRDLLQRLITTSFDPRRMEKRIAATEALIRQAIADEKKAPAAIRPDEPNRFLDNLVRQKPALRPFVNRRVESIAAQLDGKSEGQTLRPQFGPMGPPGGGRPGPLMADRFLRAAGAEGDRKLSKDQFTGGLRRLFDEADRNHDGFLDEQELADLMDRLLPPRPGPGPSRQPGQR